MSLRLEQIQNFKGRYPFQIWGLFFSEMWERFCFYGMRGMLVFFMIHQLDFTEQQANLQYAATQAFVYAFTFVGGLFADKILGFRKSLFWGGLLMIVGSIFLALDPHKFFFFGLAFIIIGTGFFKPNISTMIGDLYKEGDQRRDAGFSLFYAGINLGAFLGGYICVAIGKGYMFSSLIEEAYRWNVAFGLAAVGMVISLINFSFTQRKLGPIGLHPGHPQAIIKVKPFPKWAEYLVYGLTLLFVPLIQIMVSKTQYTDYFMWSIGPLTLVYLFYEISKLSSSERKKLWAALIFIVFSIFFWGIYEQSGGSLSIFAAKNLNDSLVGMRVDPNGVNNSAGAFFIILLAPLLGLLWLWLGKRKREPNTVIKFGLGFIFLGLGYYALFATRFFSQNGISSLNIFTLALLVITFGELCLSPIGLSIMTKLSPAKLQGIMMGIWFLAASYGQYLAGLIGEDMAKVKETSRPVESLLVYTEGYKTLGLYALIAGAVLIIISPLIRKLMQEVR
ncbi:MFS transporter [Elizabethkingia argentiflava]|uniref:MFS transporter n=1 Tax=Elizabethkingia argenteiflava TaxID=2681556 RepID=A0A845PV33_9FLAO|nr:peptide MFS transporter [Elizabethkingia argenteiflava]NAW50736.1 MFS transporter [Elizabethkingia argenteiflava]